MAKRMAQRAEREGRTGVREGEKKRKKEGIKKISNIE